MYRTKNAHCFNGHFPGKFVLATTASLALTSHSRLTPNPGILSAKMV